jgi:uncharacterized protein (TIGR00255 family)
MTAFARQEQQYSQGSIVWEIRAINHRYLDINLRLPEPFLQLESALRERIRANIQRGKLDCTLRYQSLPIAEQNIQVDSTRLQGLLQACQRITENWSHAVNLDPIAVLQWPGIIQAEQAELQQTAVITLFEQALQALIMARAQEGSVLQTLLEQRLQAMQVEVAAIRTRLPTVLNAQRQRLINRFQEASLTLDPLRLEQEMVMFTHRLDIAEELERLETHMVEVHRLLSQGGAIGRRLDFLMQELQREANTLGSKLLDVEVTRSVVELKVLIEQMREQIQNIE